MKFFLSIVLLTFLVGCTDGENGQRKLTLKELDQIATLAVIEQHKFAIDAHLWRDFMPGVEIDSSLQAAVKVYEINYRDIQKLSAHSIYVVSNNEVWYTNLLERTELTENIFEKHFSASSGPKWNTGVFAYVVIGINFNGHNTYVKVENKYIHESY